VPFLTRTQLGVLITEFLAGSWAGDGDERGEIEAGNLRGKRMRLTAMPF
jgi:hypothetical protein